MERLKTMTILALLAALAGSIALAATGGQAEVRINARQLEDGRVEFALQQRVNGEWGERILPRGRYFPADATVGRWLNSTPLTVTAAESESPAPLGSYTPLLVPSGSSGEGLDGKVWGSEDGSAGHQSRVVIQARTSDGLYPRGILVAYCDHDNPNAAIWGTVRATTNYSLDRRASVDEDGYSTYRLGQVYDSDAITGTNVVRNDDAVEFEIPNFWQAAQQHRWFAVEIPRYSGYISVTFDLHRLFGTPVEANMANCGR